MLGGVSFFHRFLNRVADSPVIVLSNHRERHTTKVPKSEKWIDPASAMLFNKLLPHQRVEPCGKEVGSRKMVSRTCADVRLLASKNRPPSGTHVKASSPRPCRSSTHKWEFRRLVRFFGSLWRLAAAPDRRSVRRGCLYPFLWRESLGHHQHLQPLVPHGSSWVNERSCCEPCQTLSNSDRYEAQAYRLFRTVASDAV